LQFVESVWLKHLVLWLCPCVQFLLQKLFSHTILPKLVEKTKETYVLPLLNDFYCVIANFDLWMSKGAHDVFVLVIKFLGSDWNQNKLFLVWKSYWSFGCIWLEKYNNNICEGWGFKFKYIDQCFEIYC
jgi:hypothetical protein